MQNAMKVVGFKIAGDIDPCPVGIMLLRSGLSHSRVGRYPILNDLYRVVISIFLKNVNRKVNTGSVVLVRNTVTHKSTVARTVMCRQDGRGRFPVLLDDHSKCRTNSQRKSQLS